LAPDEPRPGERTRSGGGAPAAGGANPPWEGEPALGERTRRWEGGPAPPRLGEPASGAQNAPAWAAPEWPISGWTLPKRATPEWAAPKWARPAGAKARGERGKNSPASGLRASAAPLWEKTSQGGARPPAPMRQCALRQIAAAPTGPAPLRRRALRQPALRHCANRPRRNPLWRAGLAQAHATLDPPPGASAPLRQAQINHEALAQRMDQSSWPNVSVTKDAR
jgi:hypothetical protein